MKNTKTKVTAPQSIEDFTKDVTDYVKTKANQEDLAYLENEIEGMIEMLEEWKDKTNTKKS